jgi:hypothetical protein
MKQELIQQGFLKSTTVNNDTYLIISTPCRIRVTQKEVARLKSEYLENEEIGGVMVAHPIIQNNEKVFLVNDIKIIRNAVEDKPIYDKKTGILLRKSNAYLLDWEQYISYREKIIERGCLPIRFHTHPTKGKDIFDKLRQQSLQTDTSEQDQIESKHEDRIESHKLLMPRGLIVGNTDFGNELFIGVYDGFVAPPSFDESKIKIQHEHFNNIGSSISKKVASWNLTDNEKIFYGITVALIFGFVVYKTRKFSVPAILSLGVVAPILLTNTRSIENPEYFNKLSFGAADIFIPKEDGKFYPIDKSNDSK